MRGLGITLWFLAFVASVAFMFFGAFRVFVPHVVGGGFRMPVDMTWFVAGVLLNIAVAIRNLKAAPTATR